MEKQGTKTGDCHEAGAKPGEPSTGGLMLGPFLKLLLMLEEQRTCMESEASQCTTANELTPLPILNRAPRRIVSGPFPKLPLALGPFLTLIFTLVERKTADRRSFPAQLDHGGKPGQIRECW
jgi:hypothetical protein